jgi:hypothetical protein
MSETLEHSRALKLGAGATGTEPETLRERLEAALVVVRVDPHLTGALLTARVLLTTLRRLPVQLALDPDQLAPTEIASLVEAATAIDSSRPVMVSPASSGSRPICVHVGRRAPAPWLRVVPDGYGAHLASCEGGEIDIGRPANAVGSVLAAAFGAAEAFKLAAEVLPGRCRRHTSLSFCPVSLTDDLTVAPELTGGEELDLALIGTGAIGTAVALILSELGLRGHVILCDPERFGPENRGTYSLGGEREAAGRPLKVDLVGDILEASGLQVTKVPEPSDALIKRVDVREMSCPPIVITALDSVPARHGTQALWADHIIDGQTGDTAAGLAVATPEGPCLRCFFAEPLHGSSFLVELSERTGIPIERLKHGDELLTEGDLALVTPEQRDQLFGTPICGLANALGLTDADPDGFRPSIPFVSQIAACLAVGRALSLLLGDHPKNNWFQLDVLQGPNGGSEVMKPTTECYCQTRADLVQRIRENRAEA